MTNGYSGGPDYPHSGQQNQPSTPSSWQSPRPPRRWIPWTFGAGGLVVIALAVVIILVVTSGGNDNKSAAPPNPAPSSGASGGTGSNSTGSSSANPGSTGSGSTGSGNAAPEPCNPGQPAILCFPQGLTPASAVTKLQSIGATCDASTPLPSCTLGNPDQDHLAILFTPLPGSTPKIMSVGFQYFSADRGQTPEGKDRTVNGLLDGMQKVLGAILPNSNTPQQIVGWVRGNMGSCPAPSTDPTVAPNTAGYVVSCNNPIAQVTSAANDVLWNVTSDVRTPLSASR